MELLQKSKLGEFSYWERVQWAGAAPHSHLKMPLDICLKPRLQGMFEQKPAQLCATLGEFCCRQEIWNQRLSKAGEGAEKEIGRQDNPEGINQEFTDKSSPGMSCRNFCSSTRPWHLWGKGQQFLNQAGVKSRCSFCQGSAQKMLQGVTWVVFRVKQLLGAEIKIVQGARNPWALGGHWTCQNRRFLVLSSFSQLT